MEFVRAGCLCTASAFLQPVLAAAIYCVLGRLGKGGASAAAVSPLLSAVVFVGELFVELKGERAEGGNGGGEPWKRLVTGQD